MSGLELVVIFQGRIRLTEGQQEFTWRKRYWRDGHIWCCKFATLAFSASPSAGSYVHIPSSIGAAAHPFLKASGGCIIFLRQRQLLR